MCNLSNFDFRISSPDEYLEGMLYINIGAMSRMFAKHLIRPLAK